jgi:Protein of unknown function (DUF3295)
LKIVRIPKRRKTDKALESDEEWKDSDESSNIPAFNEVFQRVDSKTNLVLHCSLLTIQIHNNDRRSGILARLDHRESD